MMQAETNTSILYRWTGKNRQGERLQGEMYSASPLTAKMALHRQGIAVLSIRKKGRSMLKGRKSGIHNQDIALFSRQLATMLSAGIPMLQSFEIVARSLHNPHMRDLVFGIQHDVASGSSLSQALRCHPAHFDNLYCNLVQAGERAGVLDGVLDKIATYEEKTESIKGKIHQALLYPTSVMLVALAITVLIMIYVVPQFQDLFRSAGANLPVFTRWVIQLSQLVSSYWGALIGFALVLSVWLLLRLWQHSASFRARTDHALLGIPLIGAILHKAALARFARTTATLFAAGVPLVDVLDSVAGATGNSRYGAAVLALRDEVATGQSLCIALQHQPLFPHMLIQMVMVGEESGTLDQMLAKSADFYEQAVDNRVDSLNNLLEPFIMILLGILIGGLVIALYLPVFQLGSVVTGGH